MTKRAILVGASSGIGRALARQMSAAGYELGLVARRAELLQSLQSELPNPSHICVCDIADSEVARATVLELWQTMGIVDVLILNAALGRTGKDWDEAKQMLDVNITGMRLDYYAV